ncbi:triphosphoribosyl-dephospho-CoA synthase [Aurantimonas sp. 22II-16-19i]|uniref:triphosphoribosyl-dephospho-CoA synthase n=1 Tax=Aurantimonas sp. 22II-16-19i TaxID=1317114 RepID=UPI0009F7BDF6|nr:triphosphoribosyl-dephospho-CoA synthase [Aurantimonas sp. 22II-16-19i]ORE98719.1 triphosphoribosyl-dephospho-CoA protein [Aurantimonas sp. 22II-16-19i]
MSLDAAAIEAAFLAACHAEIDTLKPGNVHRFAPGHGMTAETFRVAAAAAAPAIARPGTAVGTRILEATKASFSEVGVNANLGILLLCGPLAAAAEGIDPAARKSDPVPALRQAVGQVLAGLDDADARQAFAAIALASPGGLGTRPDNDVRTAPTIGLVAAMALAPEADLVARQYADGFREVFEVGLVAYDSPAWPPRDDLGTGPALCVYLAFAGGFPDGHIARKFGAGAAEDCRRRFANFSNALKHLSNPQERVAAAAVFDAELKAEGLNPGTSADLTVATLFAKKLAEALAG